MKPKFTNLTQCEKYVVYFSLRLVKEMIKIREKLKKIAKFF